MSRSRMHLLGLLSWLVVPVLVSVNGVGQAEELGASDVIGPFHLQFDAFPSDECPPNPNVFQDALYSTGGMSLRNQSQGGIQLAGNGTPPPKAIAAFAYWAVITAGPHTPGLHDRLIVRKLDPKKSKNAKLAGSVIGVGPDPCWPGDTTTVLKAPVPLNVVNAGGVHSGAFEVRINCAGASSCLGQDPWGTVLPPPLWQGASLVAIWPSPGRTTTLYDVGLAGRTFFGNPGITYNLVLPAAPAGATVLWDSIGADGQHGFSRPSFAGMSDERTTINGIPAAGPGSAHTDSDWNGGDSNPLPSLPSLWDTTGHAIPAPTLPILTVNVASVSGRFPTDCLTPVADIVAQ